MAQAPTRVRQECRKGGFKFCDIGAILVEVEGRPHAIHLCNLRLAERNEAEVTHARWKAMIGEKSPEANCWLAWEATGFENKMCERFTTKKLLARDLIAEAATAVQLEKSWLGESPYKEELELLRDSDGLRLDRR